MYAMSEVASLLFCASTFKIKPSKTATFVGISLIATGINTSFSIVECSAQWRVLVI